MTISRMTQPTFIKNLRRAPTHGLITTLSLVGSTLACLLIGLPAQAQDSLPIADAHVHYSHDSVELTPPSRVIEIMTEANLKFALVSSSDDNGTQLLSKLAPDLIVPGLRPYRRRGETGTWFTDPDALAYVEKLLATNRYASIGEFHLQGASADLDIPKRIVQLADEHNLILHAHSDADAIERLLAQSPTVKVIWAHSGFASPEDIATMLTKHDRLWADLAFRSEVGSGGTLSEDWVTLFTQHPDRMMLGSDTFTPERMYYIPDNAAASREWLSTLPASLAENIAWKNAYNLIMPVWHQNRDITKSTDHKHNNHAAKSSHDGHATQVSNDSHDGHAAKSSHDGHATQVSNDSHDGHAAKSSHDGHATQASNDSHDGHAAKSSHDGHATQASNDSHDGHAAKSSHDGHATQASNDGHDGHAAKSSHDGHATQASNDGHDGHAAKSSHDGHATQASHDGHSGHAAKSSHDGHDGHATKPVHEAAKTASMSENTSMLDSQSVCEATASPTAIVVEENDHTLHIQPPDNITVSQPFSVMVTVCGNDAADAQIALDASMPAHGHGMNYQPLHDVVSTGETSKTVQVDGLVLHMLGTWQWSVDFKTDSNRRKLTHDFVLE